MFKIAKRKEDILFQNMHFKTSPHLDSRKRIEYMKIWFGYSGTDFCLGS